MKNLFKLLAFLIMFPIWAFAQVPAVNDTTLYTGTNSVTPQIRYVTTQYGRLTYIWNPLINKYDLLINSKYLRANYAPISPGGYFQIANNLSEGVPATIRTNIGLGQTDMPTFNTVTVLDAGHSSTLTRYGVSFTDYTGSGNSSQITSLVFQQGNTSTGIYSQQTATGFFIHNSHYGQIGVSGAMGADKVWNFPASESGTVILDADIPGILAGYVPYTGATDNVDLGTHALKASNVIINANSGGELSFVDVGGSNHATSFQAQLPISSDVVVGVRNITGTMALTSDLASYEFLSNKVTTLDNSATHYPSTSAVRAVTDANYTAIGLKQPRIVGNKPSATSTTYATTDSIAQVLANLNSGVLANTLTFSTGLTKTSSTVTANLSVGVSGGQAAIGGTGVTDALSLKGTTGNGTLTSPAINFLVGNNGGTTGGRFLNNGNFIIGTTQQYVGYAYNVATSTIPAVLSVNGSLSVYSSITNGDAVEFSNNSPGANVGSVWDRSQTGYSSWRFRNWEGYEFAAHGVADSLSAGPFGGPNGGYYLEVSNGSKSSLLGEARFVQTRFSTGSYLREEWLNNGDHNWYDLLGNKIMHVLSTGNVSFGLVTSNTAAVLNTYVSDNTGLGLVITGRAYNGSVDANFGIGIGILNNTSGNRQSFICDNVLQTGIRILPQSTYVALDALSLSAGNLPLSLGNSSGVGIGITNPGALFEVDQAGSSNVSPISKFYVPNLASGNNIDLHIGKSASVGSTSIIGFQYNSTAANAFMYQGVFGDNVVGGVGLFVRKGGLIGVDIITPGSALQVNGGTAIGYSSSQAAPTNGLQVSGHTIFEGVTSTGATGTGNLVYSIGPTFSGTSSFGTSNFTAGLNLKGGFGSSYYNTANTFSSNVSVNTLTGNQTLTIPDATGTIALVSGNLGTPSALIGTNITGTAAALNIGGNAATVTNGVYTSGSYSNPSWVTGLAWSKISGTPTTISGYGITDAAPATGSTAYLAINGSNATTDVNIGNHSFVADNGAGTSITVAGDLVKILDVTDGFKTTIAQTFVSAGLADASKDFRLNYNGKLSWVNSGFEAALVFPSTLSGAWNYGLQDASGTLAFLSDLSTHGNSTTTGTATTAVTVTIGSTMANTNYYVDIAPQDALTAVNWYVSAKTTTTFTITFLTALTGSINFDWNVTP